MENIKFPQTVIFDIYDIISEFMSIYLHGGGPLSRYDHVFVEEVLTIICPTFIDIFNFESALGQNMIYFADNTIHYQDNLSYNDNRLLMEAVSIMAQAIVMKLKLHSAYINGYFPYTFKQLTDSRAIVFELAPEYIGDRYCDPRSRR